MGSLEELMPGMFIHFHCRTTNPQKLKFALVVSVETNCAIVVLVNSELAEFIKIRSDLLSQQVALFPSDYAFLNHDSWLDCSNAHVLTVGDVGTVQHVGMAPEYLRGQVAKIAETSRTLNRRCKSAIAASFVPPGVG